jgi:hypothetical protein
MKIAIKTKTIKEYKQAIAFLYAFGYVFNGIDTYKKFIDHGNNVDYEDYPYIILEEVGDFDSLDFAECVKGYKLFTWIKDHDALENTLNKKFTLGLTEEYDAEITTKGIQVGCQTISFDTFHKLVDLVDRFENQ